MANFMGRFTGKKPSPAKSAKDRLKFVLVTDRTTISPEDLKKMQNEILDVIRKYCRVSEDDVNLKYEQRDRENYLVADIPLTGGRAGGEGGSIQVETSIVSSSDEDNASDDSPAKAANKESRTEDKASMVETHSDMPKPPLEDPEDERDTSVGLNDPQGAGMNSNEDTMQLSRGGAPKGLRDDDEKDSSPDKSNKKEGDDKSDDKKDGE